MKSHRQILSLAGVFFLVGALTSGQDKKTPSYYPLQVGNQWTFHLDANGNTARAVSRIAKIETIDEIPLALLEASVNGKVVASEHLRQTSEGIFRYRNNRAEITPPVCLLKYPAKSGDKWGGDLKVGDDKGKYNAEAFEENIEVKAGKFKAMRVTLKVESPREGVVTTSYWWVPNVGFVRQTVNTARLNVVMELEKFQPAKKAE
jgi:hypothetical protein